MNIYKVYLAGSKFFKLIEAEDEDRAKIKFSILSYLPLFMAIKVSKKITKYEKTNHFIYQA